MDRIEIRKASKNDMFKLEKMAKKKNVRIKSYVIENDILYKLSSGNKISSEFK